MLQIRVVNGDGGGFSKAVQVEEGTTIGKFITENYGQPERFLIRLNRKSADANQYFRDGDQLIMTPIKFDGAV